MVMFEHEMKAFSFEVYFLTVNEYIIVQISLFGEYSLAACFSIIYYLQRN